MLKNLLKRIPPFAALIAERDAPIAALIAERDALIKANGFVPAGHFYSPVVSISEAINDSAKLFDATPSEIPGVDLNEAGQLRLLEEFEKLYPSIDFPELKAEGRRYFYENRSYSYSDAIMLNCMMRKFRPNRVIEVGSGHSSCAMLDTSERFLEGMVSFTFIEPYPELLKSLLFPGDLDPSRIIPSRLQDVELDLFQQLEPDDFLFIDSTHVCKTGSDVNYLLFKILPSLNSGVHIHMHDIFYPFEYPREWVLGGRSWNEIYALRAFLQFNAQFQIELMNTYLDYFHRARFAERMPLCLKNIGGSIWLRKK
ncbi:MAG TPA: class I SAM-dependent methyltransferase [Casimicrobiaceae bacterium]|nr:class I SAM-dependent methyltransferase [Casimicrobiaceae bacterium]